MSFITLLLPIFLLSSSFNILDITILQINYKNIFLFLPLSIYFFIILLAETNRVPFDLPEAEAELVAGYNVEYSAINFAVFFLAEYTNMLVNSCLFVIFFSSPSNLFFFSNDIFFYSIKSVFIACIFIVVRALLPRYRFDQLMNLC
jgi:NADH:ubiquinone oxidoreductase subunit H